MAIRRRAPQHWFEAFLEFEYRLGSLRRFHELTEEATRTDLVRQRDDIDNLSETLASMESVFDETLGIEIVPSEWEGAIHTAAEEDHYADQDAFPEFVHHSVLAMTFTELEALLNHLVVLTADDLGVEVELGDRGAYLDRAFRFLQRQCNVPIDLSKAQRKQLSALREVRNTLIHALSRDLSVAVRAELQELLDQGEKAESAVSRDFVLHALDVIGSIGEDLKQAYEDRDDV